ncbi:MAG: rod shape-determining protein MreC [Muribaculaceae bacterium]|nr:rod shape-determining protein MreC [Muribaculaceae bacterium]
MNELFGFIVRHSKWLVFAFFVTISCTLLFNDDPYRRHVFMTSAGRMAATVYKGANNVTSYFDLREINGDLNRRNAELQAEIVRMQETIDRLREQNFTDTLALDSGVRHFDFIVAHVINNSISHPFNYLTINKGSSDGIKPELGVIDRNGVVGIVSTTGAHSARVISLLNPHFRLSCKIKRSDYFGSLVWDGANPSQALLEELPRHTVFEPGDTIVTSGYSAVFPSGLPVGVIIGADTDRNQNFFTLRVRLLADFTTLGNVQVVINNQAEEIRALSAGEENDSKKKPFGN